MTLSRVGVPRKVPRDGTLPSDEKPENRACGGPPRSLPPQEPFPLVWQFCHTKIVEGGFNVRKIATRELVFMALLISLNIVLTRIASIRISMGGVEGIRIGFGGFPVILGGIMFGPVAGGIVGAMGDVLGYYINPMGPYMPHFTLTAALTGMIPALVLGPVKRQVPNFWQLLLAIGIGQTISSVILVPYFLQLLFKIPMVATLPAKILGQAIHVPVYALFAEVLLKRINMVLRYNTR